ncbi:MAG: ABC transporter ATP-binding protein [Acidimicrobiia bacterium]
MLELRDVSKVYRVGTFGSHELLAVNHVSFDIAPGEVISLIGESGSGKSTIGKMILRLISVSSGSILFQGQDISELKRETLKEYYRTVQGVFQDPFSSYNPIFKADRVFEIVRQGYFSDLGRKEWAEKVDEALESVGLNPGEVRNKYPHQLSGGQLQRMLIARTLLLDIDILIADEIISMLDASTRIDVLNLLADLAERGLAILFVTHDLSLGYYISERTVIMYRGSVVEMGDTKRVFGDPLHPYTQMLLTAIPHLDERWDGGIDDIKDVLEINQSGAFTPNGCVYYDRCPVAQSELGCNRAMPELVELDQDHQVACFKAVVDRGGPSTGRMPTSE